MNTSKLVFEPIQLYIFSTFILVMGFMFGWSISKFFFEYKEANKKWNQLHMGKTKYDR